MRSFIKKLKKDRINGMKLRKLGNERKKELCLDFCKKYELIRRWHKGYGSNGTSRGCELKSGPGE